MFKIGMIALAVVLPVPLRAAMIVTGSDAGRGGPDVDCFAFDVD